MGVSQHPVAEKIQPEIEQMLADYGYELVQIKLGGRPAHQTLTIVIDKPDGVDSNDCQYVSQRLSLLLDMLDPIESSYNLIVSSPGIERPLVKDDDFERFAGELARVRFVSKNGKRQTVVGRLAGTAEGEITLETSEGRVDIALADIETANLIYDWEKEVG